MPTGSIREVGRIDMIDNFGIEQFRLKLIETLMLNLV